MRIVFFGSAEFAVPSLKLLLDSQHEVLAVVTRPDKEKGRHLKMRQTPVKILGSARGIKVYQPEDITSPEAAETMASLLADLFVIVAFGQILTADILKLPKRFSINLHPSLLPRYRGAAPINRAIINGDAETGLTIIRMNEKVDAGDIILQRKVQIAENDTSETLSSQLSRSGALLLSDAIRFIEEDNAQFKKQNDRIATFAPRLTKEDGLIDWNKTAREIHNKVRGTIPWPGAYTYFQNKKINIWKTAVLDGKYDPGEIVEAEKALIIGTQNNLIKIEELQLEGKKRMPTPDFLRGFRELKKGNKLN